MSKVGPSGAYEPGDEPPPRRFTMTITAEADCTDALIDVLEQVDYALSEKPDTERQIVSSQGWTLHVTENPEAPTGDEYDAALGAWWKAKRAARRAAPSAPSSQEPS